MADQSAAWSQPEQPDAGPPDDDPGFCSWLAEESLELLADLLGATAMGSADLHLGLTRKEKFGRVTPKAKAGAKAKAKARAKAKAKASPQPKPKAVAPMPATFEGSAAPGGGIGPVAAPFQGSAAPGGEWGYGQSDPYGQSYPYYNGDPYYNQGDVGGGVEEPEKPEEVDEEGILDDIYRFTQHYPVFCIVWSLLIFGLWLIFSIKDGESLAGFESIWPGETSLALYNDCEDYRSQIWRWWSYQFTHLSFTHVATNVLLLCVLGIQLEGYHGSFHIFFFFQIGVFGGAMCYLVSDCHVKTVGMSGGCYSLIGMHIGDIALNWAERPRRWAKLLLIAMLHAVDLLQSQFLSSDSGSVSHSAHFGGWIAGCVICTLFGYNSKVHDYERLFQVVALLVGVGCTAFCLGFGLQWAPRTIFDDVPWCWTRQVKNKAIFGDWEPHCVRCDGQECIDKWSAEKYIATVSIAACESIGGWDVSER